jgi:hypothetical protein
MAVEHEILDHMKCLSAAHSHQVLNALRNGEETASILLLARELSASNPQATEKPIECCSSNLAENTATSAACTTHTNASSLTLVASFSRGRSEDSSHSCSRSSNCSVSQSLPPFSTLAYDTRIDQFHPTHFDVALTQLLGPLSTIKTFR